MALTNLQRLRLNIVDPYREFQDSQLGDGSTIHFRLSSFPVKANSQQLYVAGALKTEGTDYTLDDNTGKITFTSAPADGANIFVRGEASIFSDDELNDLLDQHTSTVRTATLHALRVLMADHARRERWQAGDLHADGSGVVKDLDILYKRWLEEDLFAAIDEGGIEEWATEQEYYRRED